MLRSLKMKKIRTVRQIKRLWQQRAFSEPWFRGMKHLKPLSIFVQKMFWCTQVNPQVKRSRLGWEHVKSLYSCTLKIVISVFCMWLCPSSPGLWLQVPPSSSCSAPEKNTCIGIRNCFQAGGLSAAVFCVLLPAHPASCQHPCAVLWDALNLSLWNSDPWCPPSLHSESYWIFWLKALL